MQIRWDDVKALFRNAQSGVLEHLEQALPTIAELTTPVRLAYFLAQTAHETIGFRYLRELGNNEYFCKYEQRKDLGNTQSGDGLKYIGRGLIMITGRTNYAACGDALHLPLLEQPQLLEQPAHAVDSACWFWKTHNLNKYSDACDLRAQTRKINGGLNGLNERQYWLSDLLHALEVH